MNEYLMYALLAVTFIICAVVCYRTIKAGKIGPAYGLHWRTAEEREAAARARQNKKDQSGK